MGGNQNALYHIHLNVRLLPGMRIVRVPLHQGSTASDVVNKCKEILNLDAEYSLAADFNGFEKQFNAQERLYHLVKKQILLAGLDGQVQFFIRKMKKQCSVEPSMLEEDSGGINNAEPVGAMMENEKVLPSSVAVGETEGRFIDDSNAPYFVQRRFSSTNTSVSEGHQMAENGQLPPNRESSSGEAWLPNMNSMSYAELLEIANRQKRQIETNKATMTVKEAQLNSVRNNQQHQEMGHNTETEVVLKSRLHQLRQQIKAEDAQLQRLRRMRSEIEEERRRSVTSRFDLQEARRILAEKERHLKETSNRVQELMQQLDVTRRRRTLLAKENEIKQLDYALAATRGKFENGSTDVVDAPNGAVSAPMLAHLQPYQQRPKAAIEPFNVVPPSHSGNAVLTDKMPDGSMAAQASDCLPPGSSLDYLHSKGFVAAFTAMEEVLQQTTEPCPSAAATAESGSKPVCPTYATGRATPVNGHLPVTYSKPPQSGKQAIVSRGYAQLVLPGSKMNASMDEKGTVRKLPESLLQQRHSMFLEQSGTACSWANGPQRRSDTPIPQPVIPKINISINRRFQIANASPLLYEEMPPPDLIPASEKLKFSSFDDTFGGSAAQAHAIGSVQMENAVVSSGVKLASSNNQHSETIQGRGDADKIHLRNDTLRAAKRRSWAENHLPVTTDEAEHIRLLLTRAQQKGKSSVNLSWIFDQLTTSSCSQNYHDSPRHGVYAVAATTAAALATTSHSLSSLGKEAFSKAPSPPPASSATATDQINANSGSQKLNELEDENGKTDSQAISPSLASAEDESPKVRYDDLAMYELKDDDDAEAMLNAKRRCRLETEGSETDDEDRSVETVVERVSPAIELKPPPSKGILRLKPKDASESRRRVQFDALALLLDAALEGQLDLVKSCAAKLTNVSTCNEEGITAMHNAICAGHYEIVRFLVEAGADVNAEDRDGWTPLHCAASCNNLPMVKFLIERGACIFATTTKDHETPADKCEKEEEGFDGCSQFLYSVQEKMGVLNGGRVYGAYDYEAEFEDELSLKADEPIIILRREDEKEKGWWWAKRESNSEEGFVPRNYLALYPRLVAQRAGALTSANSAPLPEPDATPETETKAPDDIGKNEILPSDPVTTEP